MKHNKIKTESTIKMIQYAQNAVNKKEKYKKKTKTNSKRKGKFVTATEKK